MERKRLAKKWISMVTGWEESFAIPGSEEAKHNLEDFKVAIGKARNIQNMRTADLYFAYPQQIKAPEDIYKLITDCIRRYDVKFIMFDNLQLLCDLIIGSRQGQRTVLLSQISKGLARIAKDHGKVMIRIVQPKQLEKGATIESRDVDGSSQIEKDCDCQLLMWRKVLGTKTQSAYEEETKGQEESSEVFDSLTRITVALSRYSSGGKCWLTFDGAKSQVRSQDTTQKSTMQQAFNELIPTEKGTAAVAIPTEGITV
jgi:replicative DNA helicase